MAQLFPNTKREKEEKKTCTLKHKHKVCFDTLEQLPKTSKTLATPDTKKTAATTSATVRLRRLPSHGHDFPQSFTRHFRQTKVPDNVASCLRGDKSRSGSSSGRKKRRNAFCWQRASLCCPLVRRLRRVSFIGVGGPTRSGRRWPGGRIGQRIGEGRSALHTCFDGGL